VSEPGHRDRCAIVGIGATEYSSASGRSVLTLATEAARAAVADAGLVPGDVDGIVRSEHDEVLPNALSDSLGLDALTYWASVGTGGGAPCGMIGQAIGAILSGQATTVLVYRSLNGRSGRRFGQGGSERFVGGCGSYDELFIPYGLLVPGQMFALIAQRHMVEFGTTSEQLGHIALACRARAQANPAAQMYGRSLTMADYLSARPISLPLRLNDFCLETDGACAVVVTGADRAADSRWGPVLIRAVAQGSPRDVQPGVVLTALLREALTTQPSPRSTTASPSRSFFNSRTTASAQRARVGPSPPAAQSGSTASCRSTPRAATCRRGTFTASATSPKVCVNSGALPPARSREPRRASSRPAFLSPRVPLSCERGDRRDNRASRPGGRRP
jgi:acetyl-CoA acetyltransferase